MIAVDVATPPASLARPRRCKFAATHRSPPRAVTSSAIKSGIAPRTQGSTPLLLQQFLQLGWCASPAGRIARRARGIAAKPDCGRSEVASRLATGPSRAACSAAAIRVQAQRSARRPAPGAPPTGWRWRRAAAADKATRGSAGSRHPARQQRLRSPARHEPDPDPPAGGSGRTAPAAPPAHSRRSTLRGRGVRRASAASRSAVRPARRARRPCARARRAAGLPRRTGARLRPTGGRSPGQRLLSAGRTLWRRKLRSIVRIGVGRVLDPGRAACRA